MTRRDTNVRNDLLIAALAAGATQVGAARAAGMSERTVRRREAEPGFAAQVEAARDELSRKVTGRLVGLATMATDVLEELLASSDTPPATRLKTAVAVLSAQGASRQSTELEARLRLFEEMVAASTEVTS